MNLKTNLQIIGFFVILIIISCNSAKRGGAATNEKNSSQPQFEGKIVYSLNFEDKTGALTKEQAKMIMGNQKIYTIKGSKYKNELGGMMKITQYYTGQDTLFNQIEGMDNLLWVDARSNPDTLISYKIDKNAETINGIDCDLLTINSKEGVTKYYFNKKYSVRPEYYINHEYGFWKFCIDKTKSIPIKSVSDTKDVYIEIVAKEIKKMKIEDSEFNIPDLPRRESSEK